MHPGADIYGLLYFDPDNDRHVNIHGRHSSIDIYLRCAANCSRSFRRLGTTFRLITNNRKLLTDRLLKLDIPDLEILEHGFQLPVPAGIPFFSAHFKLELYSAFGTGAYGQYVALVDIDTLLLRQLPASSDLSVYDISDQIFPRYGRDTVMRDLRILTGRDISDGRWYGGEFIMGSSEQFGELANFINLCWPQYIANISTVHHLGDEMVLSAAINLYFEQHALADYGTLGYVTRWWSSRTFNEQIPLRNVRNTALLHLPADKPFIARCRLDGSSSDLLDEYERYVYRKLLIRSIIPSRPLLGYGPKKFTPRLS